MMLREELMIRPVFAIPGFGEARPALTVDAASPPWAPTPGISSVMSPTIVRISSSCLG